jgi:hypothetical protein
MRGRPCATCIHEDLPAIEAAILAGDTIASTAARFGISKSALHRHELNCLAPKVAAAARVVQPKNEAKAPVFRAKQIVEGKTPVVGDILSLHGLLEHIEDSAQAASQDGLHSALAALSGQISRSVEVAARMQSIGYKDAPQGAAGPGFSINICLPDTAPTRHAIVDCTAGERES